jgi:glycerophosphoryl diester phosphodiesterase
MLTAISIDSLLAHFQNWGMEFIRAGEMRTHYQNRRVQFIKLAVSIYCLLWLLGSGRVQASTNFSKLIAWGQVASASVPSPPGNSLPFINHCFELGYEGMELDVEISKDNIPILSHGVYLPNGDSADPTGYTFAELQQFIFGNWAGETVYTPTLEAALQTNGNRGTILIMDMRVAASDADAISNAVHRAAFDQRRLAASAYDIGSGQAFKQALPQTRIFLKSYEVPENIPLPLVDQIEAAGLDGLMLAWSNNYEATKLLADYLHRKGLKLALFVHYGFNTLPELQSLIETDADYILTVHHEMRDLLHWPIRVLQAPVLKVTINPEKQNLTLIWQPQLPYSHRVQTSVDSKNWEDLKATIGAGPTADEVQCTVSITATSGFYRLCYTP